MLQISSDRTFSRHLQLLIGAFLFLCLFMPRASHAQPPQAQSQPSQASPDEGRFYPNPGIVANRGGRWVGSDHLYNLTDKIDIVVEIFKPENVQVPVSEEMIKARVIEIFKKGKIEPQAESAPGKPPLPFFHLLLMIYPIDKGYVALCEGRLFEEVHLDRIILDEQTVLQGITWESENLIVSPSADIEEQVFKSVDEIANTFVDRFIFYSNIKAQIKKR